jgi:hypothetical protein
MLHKGGRREGLHNLYASTNIIRLIKSRRIRGAEHAAHTGKMKNASKILVGEAAGKNPLGRSKRR